MFTSPITLFLASFGKGMLPMIVVMNALVMTMGIVGYLGFTITVVSMVAAAMIMGLGIDFGIHQVYSYFEERKKKIETKYPLLFVVRICYVILLLDMTLR